jgi:PleD family two-component response regulator
MPGVKQRLAHRMGLTTKILLIDDARDLCVLVATVLEKAGYRVRSA